MSGQDQGDGYDLGMSAGTQGKARENRARRAAARQGIHLRKSKTRDPRALTFGRWYLVGSDHVDAAGYTLDQVERILTGGLPGGDLTTGHVEQ